MTFKVGDTVIRIQRPFRDLAVGDTGKVVVSTKNFICLEGHTVTANSPFLTKFDPSRFKLASEDSAADHNADAKHSQGTKLGGVKPRFGLMLDAFSNAVTEVAKVHTFESSKDTDSGWLAAYGGWPRYTDALFSHHFAEARGEELDKESGLHHAAHRAWIALVALEMTLREKGASNAGTTTR